MPHRTWFLFLLLLSTVAYAQQPNTPSAPAGIPQIPPDSIPPDTKAPPPQVDAPDQRVASGELGSTSPQGLAPDEVRRRIVKDLHSASGLAGSNIHVKVTSTSVILSGSVRTMPDRQLAKQIAESYAEDRSVVNRLTSRQSK
jgi:BON domain